MRCRVFGPDGKPCRIDQIPGRSSLPWLLAGTTAPGLWIGTSYHAVSLDGLERAFQTAVVATDRAYAEALEVERTGTPAAAFRAHAASIRRLAAPGSGLVTDPGSGPIVTVLITGMTIRSTPGRASSGWEGTAPLTAVLRIESAHPVVRDDVALSAHCAYVTAASAVWDGRPPSAFIEW